MNVIKINGRTYSSISGDIVIRNGVVTIDGKIIDEEDKGKIMKIEWEGELANLKCDSAVSCGNVHDVDAGGSVNCGNVAGNVDAGGSVNCGSVAGNIDAGGSVCCNKG